MAQSGGEQMSESRSAAALPYARGRRFDSLEAYLSYLAKANGPIDLPWWREIAPDRYELMTSMRSFEGEREIATRAQLMTRYGFDR